MRTVLRQEHLAAIIEDWFERNDGGSVNFMVFGDDEDGKAACTVDHKYTIELPAPSDGTIAQG